MSPDGRTNTELCLMSELSRSARRVPPASVDGGRPLVRPEQPGQGVVHPLGLVHGPVGLRDQCIGVEEPARPPHPPTPARAPCAAPPPAPPAPAAVGAGGSRWAISRASCGPATLGQITRNSSP